jgi:iron complex transport system permease protein
VNRPRKKNDTAAGSDTSPRLAARREGFRPAEYLIFALLTFIAFLICCALGSANVPLGRTAAIVWGAIRAKFAGNPLPAGTQEAIILMVRLPRVMSTALVGAALSVCGAAMQGLLKNPLADGSTLGVSSGASLGAVIAIAFGVTVPGLPFAGTMGMAIVFAFGSLMIILALAYKLDYSLSTNTIILIGVIFSMFAASVISLVMTFAGENVKHIAFWTMGSLSGSTYTNVLILRAALAVCGGIVALSARELNAFAIGEENARHIGVNVRRVKLTLMISVSVMIGVCVSVGGTIGFVGLVTPHMLRMIVGPNHKRLIPASVFGGAVFLMLADLTSRILLNPLELPIGVVTSFIGAILFVYIFYRSRRGKG